MPKRNQLTDRPAPAARGHAAIRAQFHAYAGVATLGSHPAAVYPEVARHVEGCLACRRELEELIELARAAQAAQFEPPPPIPAAKLAFLKPRTTRIAAPRQRWRLDALGHLVIAVAEDLLAALRQPAPALATRGQLLYSYVQPPGSVADLNLKIEIFISESAPDLAHVRVDVDIPSRDTFDQSGSTVLLRAEQASWQATTDEAGSAEFAAIPLDALLRLQVEIAPLRMDGQ